MKQQFDGFLASPSFQRLYPCALVIDSNNCSIQMGADPAVPMADLVVLNVGAVAGNNCIQLNHTTITIFDCIATRNRDRILALVAFLRSTRPVDNALQQPTTTLLHIAELQSSISLCKSEHLSVNKRLLESTSANLKLVNAKVNPADGALAIIHGRVSSILSVMTGYIESRGQIQSQLAQFGARTEHLESKISEKRSALKTIDHKVQYLLRRDEYARRWKQQFRGMMLALIAGMGVLVALLAYR